MEKIYNYTTPTIIFNNFQLITPAEITVAYLTIKQDGQIILEKNMSELTIGESSISYTMTQEESAVLGTEKAKAQLTWVTAGGLRGVSETLEAIGVAVQKSEVI